MIETLLFQIFSSEKNSLMVKISCSGVDNLCSGADISSELIPNGSGVGFEVYIMPL